ncbi:glycosyltransferase [Alishewanella sp. d11]|uniref:glycosyltransferase n=1 Tax=Alishewanella sp. d11 TaxID=3414030 RepID=UPI003BF8BE4C
MPLLVVIGYVWPEPASSAAGSRMLSLIRLFQTQGYQVIFASAAEKSPHRFDLPSIGVAEQSIVLNCDSFQQWLQTLAPQIVMFDRFMLEEQFGWRVAEACPEALRILDMEDVHALRHARHEAVKADSSLVATAVSAERLNNDLAYREVAAIYRCDLTLVISRYEMQLLQQHYHIPAHLLCYCPFWQAGPFAQVPDFADRAQFISIGNFRHAPNWQAVLWLKQQIWPLIRKQLPKAELHIYGAYPPPKATALHNARDGFLVKGWAEDAVAVMQQARLCLAPLQFGAGLKGKLLEAMQCGTPSITTSVGAEGMTLSDIPADWCGAITDNAEGFATAACALYQDESAWQAAQQQGYRILTERFSADQAKQVWQLLQQLLDESATARSARRHMNFTGQMLQSHAYRSTRYMGQWIAAKNRNNHD